MTIMIECLKEEIMSGTSQFPIFISFIPAEDILKIAEVPSFKKTTNNHDIAENVLTPPIKDWQRPLNEERIKSIADVFSNIGNLMPNPVLLCQNLTAANQKIKVSTKLTSSDGIPTGTWEIEMISPNKTNTILYGFWMANIV